ncbi:hypothetical protein [Acinetobacter gyllenbergii]|uniref:hypothetical protein n=1 Tax=Acinetobacter gyllenbergii TaxID=134534 RepID=UPI000806E540|nr:hypothetical protein [Acinetobacter gyllenbergii]OBY73714.1 hypothetical protein NG55_13745 [Acinetobacter gyllenbergii]
MIKISFAHNEDFLNRYKKHVITDRLLISFRGMISRVPEVDKVKILAIFTDDFIIDLILCNADKLNEKISIIYDNLPILSERYCLEYYLKDIPFDPDIASRPIRKKSDKDQIKIIHEQIINRLQSLPNLHQSIYIPLIIRKMQSTTLASKIKEQLISLNSMKLGNHILDENIKSLYPNWVTEFANLFDYNAMSQVFGREITNNMDLDVCLYCNNEDIETINIEGAETRPDLDHFFPKSKFPFLALTLSNLIPAGNRCNQKYKKATSMLGYTHPFIDGINENKLFNINYIFDEGRTIDAIKITIDNQNNDLDKNLSLFRVEATHNKNDVKNWFLKFEERFQLLKSSAPHNLDEILSNPNSVRIILDVDTQSSPKKEQYLKLKIDALNLLSKKNFKMIN